VIAGVFVGGRSRRMGGVAKGLLPAPGRLGAPSTTVIARTIALAREQCDHVVLVGRAEAYASLGIAAIDDEATAKGEGPLAGLVALLAHARGQGVIALACDMPYVTRELLARLARAEGDAPALAPKDGGKWSPLFARYDASRVESVARATLASGERAMQAVLDACGARELPVSEPERACLRDWDEPGDLDRGFDDRDEKDEKDERREP
jgi:molybdopterin-guanine dinucleotide biosynthesis protein A